MSALAHIIESLGVATVVISLIRPHTEKVQPPRALWVPFQLGRPLGSPGEPDFQARVLRQALDLLERRDGPVILDDFADDEPRAADDPAWMPPFESAAAAGPEGAALIEELARMRPFYDRAVSVRGRSTVGLSGLDLPQAVDFLASCLAAFPASSPAPSLTPGLALRFVADDLKAAWTEAASLQGKPSSGQLGDWLWQRTALGRALLGLRERALASENAQFKAVGGTLLVPGARIALMEAAKAS